MKSFYHNDFTRFTDDNKCGVDVTLQAQGGDTYIWRAWVANEHGVKHDLLSGKLTPSTLHQAAQAGLTALDAYLLECHQAVNQAIIK